MFGKWLAVLTLSILCVESAWGCWSVFTARLPRQGDPKDKTYTSEIGEVLSAETKHSALDLILKFLSYGCYCGPGGDGIPRDNLDRCCQEHDYCYNNLSRIVKGKFTRYHLKYTYEFIYNQHLALCDAKINTEGEQMKCECDRKLGICMRQHWTEYCSSYDDLRILNEKQCNDKPPDKCPSTF